MHRSCSIPVLFLALAAPLALGQTPQPVTRVEARQHIQEGNIAWGKARVALDRNAFDRIMGPASEFYVRFSDGKRMDRQQFLERISSPPAGIHLTRFDASVLTVEPNGDDWVCIILEKLAIERTGPGGKAETEYVVSITRDGWRRLSDGRWVVLFSEQVGQEHWKGAPPPLAIW
jgi:hypothetical protein